MRVAFLYNAQFHQILHSLPFALELSAMPGVDVDILSPTQAHQDFIADLARLYPEHQAVQKRLEEPGWLKLAHALYRSTVPPKALTLFANRRLLDGYDALVVPERSTTVVRRFGVTRPKLIHTAHGAGDRATAIDPRIKLFDFFLVPGPKTASWLLERGLVRPGGYAVGAYAKLDIVRRLGERKPRLFPTDKPVILYNPHFKGSLSSWPKWGEAILDRLAAQDRYNVIFAPHVRLFDPPSPADYERFTRFRDLPHMLIDLGSARSVDMTYTAAADLYLGEVSSQVYEFLLEPRPCVFLNAHHVAWQGNERYGSWTLGPVVERVDALMEAIDRAFASHGSLLAAQREAVERTFDLGIPEPGRFGARRLHDYLTAATIRQGRAGDGRHGEEYAA
ncbi:sensor domain-containing protein [Azospirillum sp. SYSU D00513]|uniref:sensor domain-containing protein n=1 Tax=Azospirillum sp. SYSU D00513 TaxID=2812561 RepID=UPI001A96F860|nr:sensor domain-containing protein [Azospirillum sp. SYSU D00513]